MCEKPGTEPPIPTDQNYAPRKVFNKYKQAMRQNRVGTFGSFVLAIVTIGVSGFAALGIWSTAAQRCKTFNETADGYVRGFVHTATPSLVRASNPTHTGLDAILAIIFSSEYSKQHERTKCGKQNEVVYLLR
eukprot:2068943-Amphidinium_carterae.1